MAQSCSKGASFRDGRAYSWPFGCFFFWVVRPPFLWSWKETNYLFRSCNGRNQSKVPNLKKTEGRLCWVEGAPNLLRKAPLGAKSAIFMPEWHLHLQDGTISAYGIVMGEKVALFVSKWRLRYWEGRHAYLERPDMAVNGAFSC